MGSREGKEGTRLIFAEVRKNRGNGEYIRIYITYNEKKKLVPFMFSFMRAQTV